MLSIWILVKFPNISNKTIKDIINDYNKQWDLKLGNLLTDSLLTNEQCEFNWMSYTYAIKGLAKEINDDMLLIDQTISENEDLHIMLKSPICEDDII